MRKSLLCLCVLLLASAVGCVTINVYFPEAAAEKAADQFIGSVLDDTAPVRAPSVDKPKPDEPAEPAQERDRRPSASVLDLLIPAAHAAEKPNLRIHTPAVDAIHDRMRQRYRSKLRQLLDQGVVGFTADGLVAVRDASSAPLAQRASINDTVSDANRDRNALYREIANANGHPEWESKIRKTFASLWIEKAHGGWYYRTASGAWKKK